MSINETTFFLSRRKVNTRGEGLNKVNAVKNAVGSCGYMLVRWGGVVHSALFSQLNAVMRKHGNDYHPQLLSPSPAALIINHCTEHYYFRV